MAPRLTLPSGLAGMGPVWTIEHSKSTRTSPPGLNRARLLAGRHLHPERWRRSHPFALHLVPDELGLARLRDQLRIGTAGDPPFGEEAFDDPELLGPAARRVDGQCHRTASRGLFGGDH